VQLVLGLEDQTWPSSDLADIALRRPETQRHPFPFRHIEYPEAGRTIIVLYWHIAVLAAFPAEPSHSRASWACRTIPTFRAAQRRPMPRLASTLGATC